MKAESGELKNMLPAALLVRGSAIAVDLCLTVCVCTLGFALLSLATPADSSAAKLPILFIMIAACVYVGWGRNRFASVGRWLFRLQVARLAAPSARPGRPVTVHMDAQPHYGTRVAAGVGAIITSCALLTALSLIQVLDSTSVFKAVKAHTASTQPFAAQYGVPPALSRLPSALLIGERSAFVQVSASWGERTQSLDYYLLRSDGQWQVQAVQPAREHLLAKYMLQAPEKDIPQAPQ